MPDQGWIDEPGDPVHERFEVAFPPAPPLQPTPAPPPVSLVPLPLSVRVADRLRAIPWWVRFVLPAVAAFALVAGVGDLTKGEDPQRTATAGPVASTTPTTEATTTTAPSATTAAPSTTTRSPATTPGTSSEQPAGATTTTRRPGAAVTVPTTPTVPVPVTTPTLDDLGDGTDQTGPYYTSCAEAKSAGATPLLRGLPGYRSALDPDGDGFACGD
jgi:hypothetical protein